MAVISKSYFFFEKVLLRSIAERPTPNPINTQTIRMKTCAPKAIGELNISSKIISSFH